MALGLFLLPAACSREQAGRSHDGVPILRVRLLQSQDQVSVAATRPPTAHTSTDPTPKTLNFSERAVTVTLSGGGWRVGAATLGSGVLTLMPATDGSVTINGQPYHGSYRLVPVTADRFDVVNDVDIEDYLKGVVAKEMLRLWDLQAYEAQAIVARTYALYEMKTAPDGRYWDLYPDQRSQVYGGIGAESGKSVEAVDATRGIVVAYGPRGQERIFKAYFSACCGGISQSASDAFGDPWSEPLSDQNRGAICAASPTFTWGPILVRKDELTRRIRSWGAKRNRPEQSLADLRSIDIASINRFGRPVRFVVTDSRGAQYNLSGEEMRMAINTEAAVGSTVYSSFFRPVNDADAVRFIDGHGHGHGVGLCQWCAQVRAEHGQRAEDIVLSFYPRGRLVRAY